MKVAIVDYGSGNINSVGFALDRLGASYILTNKEDEIRSADKVILPGVGRAGSAMSQISMYGLKQIIPTLKQDVLGICLGMQLMLDYSEEDDTPGLGIIPGKVVRFNNAVKVPQIGWNKVQSIGNKLIPDDDSAFVYYVNSFYLPVQKETIGVSEYGTSFSAAIAKDNFYGCQFHPEKSGEYGKQILKNFLEL